MDLAIIITIIAILIGIKIITSIWRSSLKETDEYYQLAEDAEFRTRQLKKYLGEFNNGNERNSKLIYKIARINAIAEDFSEAAAYFKLYTELEPEDSEGFAELAESCLHSGDTEAAKAAIAWAIKLEPSYEGYREQQLRIGLNTNNLEYAAQAAADWKELDAERVKKNQRPHRWSPMYQIGPKHAVPDIALKAYDAALAFYAGNKAAASTIIEEMTEGEREYFTTLTAEDKLFTGMKEIYEES